MVRLCQNEKLTLLVGANRANQRENREREPKIEPESGVSLASRGS